MFLGWEVHTKSLYIVIAKLFPNRLYAETKSIILKLRRSFSGAFFHRTKDKKYGTYK